MFTVGEIAASMAPWSGFRMGDKIIGTLDKDSKFMNLLGDNFQQQVERYRIVSFWGDKDPVCSLTTRNE